MLHEELISQHEHNNLWYTTQLFGRLHDLIYMNMPFHNRKEIVEVLTNLFELGKITKTAFLEMCINV